MFAHVLMMEAAFMKKKIARKTMPTTQKDSIFSRVRVRMVTPDPFVIQILTLVKKIPSHVTQASPVLIFRHLQTKLDSSATRVQVVTQEMGLIAQVYHNYRLLTRQNEKGQYPTILSCGWTTREIPNGEDGPFFHTLVANQKKGLASNCSRPIQSYNKGVYCNL